MNGRAFIQPKSSEGRTIARLTSWGHLARTVVQDVRGTLLNTEIRTRRARSGQQLDFEVGPWAGQGVKVGSDTYHESTSRRL